MHLPATSEFIFNSFAHRTLAGLGPNLGTCPCDVPALKVKGVGQATSSLLAGLNPITAGVSAGVGIATTFIGSWLADKRATGQQKVASTSVVNDLEPLLQQNVAAYMAGPGTCADQAAALSAFDSAWQWLQTSQACGNIQLGTAGQNCINDRAPGGKWDWTAMYRTPIASDTRPQCDTSANAAEQASVTNIFNKISGSNVQTNAATFSNALDSGAASTGASNAVTGTASADLTSLAQSLTTGTTQIAGASVPTIALLFGGALILVLALSGGKH